MAEPPRASRLATRAPAITPDTRQQHHLDHHPGTRQEPPAKLSFAMVDSPVGIAAWIIEAFHAWSDRGERPFDQIFTRDQLLTEVMLYLVTDAFATSIWIYGGKRGEEMTLPAGQRVEVPTGLSAFPDPVFPMPPREVAEKSHFVVRYSTMTRGGHFPFYEVPEVLVEELRAFSRLLAK